MLVSLLYTKVKLTLGPNVVPLLLVVQLCLCNGVHLPGVLV